MTDEQQTATCAVCRQALTGGRCTDPYCTAARVSPAEVVDLESRAPQPNQPSGFAPAPAQEFYLGSRLRFGPVDASLSGTVTLRMVLHLLVRAFLFWLGCVAVAGILSLFTYVFTRQNLAGFFVPLAYLAAFAVFLIPIRIPVSEWHWVVDGRAGSARSAYLAILAVVEGRNAPFKTERRRIVTDVDAKSGREYLCLREGRFTAYVSAFAYGDDLFVGWTMWWEAFPPVFIWEFLRQSAAAMIFRGTFFHRTFAADRAKAFRDVVHAATREGVDAAHTGRPVEPTFGMRVTDDKVPSWV